MRHPQWLDLQIRPPGPFVSVPMQILVMGAAQRDGVLVADLAAESPWLGELQMVGVARALPADEAGLVPDKQQVRLASLAGRLLGMGQPLGDGWREVLQRALDARRSLWERRRRNARGLIEGRSLFGHPGSVGLLKLGQIGGLDELGVRLPKGVFERKAGLGPDQQVLVGRQDRELV
nr:hypothetical protein [Bradyrhizobium brasilense]